MPKSRAAKARAADARAARLGQPLPGGQTQLEDWGYGQWGVPSPWLGQMLAHFFYKGKGKGAVGKGGGGKGKGDGSVPGCSSSLPRHWKCRICGCDNDLDGSFCKGCAQKRHFIPGLDPPLQRSAGEGDQKECA